VNLRDPDDNAIGTNVGTMFVTLGTDIEDPLFRLSEIKKSSLAAKAHLGAVPSSMGLAYTLLTHGPALVGQVTGLDGLMPPIFSLAISNIPGPNKPIYLDGAQVEAMYPASLLMRRGALNITCVSCSGTLNFGFTGARDTLPHLQRMAVYLGEAVPELESVLGTLPAVTPSD